MVDDQDRRLDEGALRALVPRVLAGLVGRGEDFDAAEDALQDALLEALRVWPDSPARDPRAWLTDVATRRLIDARRSAASRHGREEQERAEPRPAGAEEGDDTLFLLFCCCHPDLTPASQVALCLRAVVVLGAEAGLRETDRLRGVLGERHRWHAVRGYLHELGGDLSAAAAAYAEAAHRATSVAERDHLVRQAGRARAVASSQLAVGDIIPESR